MYINNMSSDTVSSLLNVNGLGYAMPPALSVATQRRMVRAFPQVTTSANGGQIIYSLQTGDQLVYGPGSYMRIRLSMTGGSSDADRHIDTIASLFGRVTVSTRSGQELCRVEDFSLYVSKHERYTTPLAKWSRLSDPCVVNTDLDFAGDHIVAVMPLSWIPCFKNDTLLPSQLMEGLRIQFDLNTPAVAFRHAVAGTPVTAFTVTSNIHLDCTTLADQFSRRIAEVSASDGLVLLHKEPFHTIVNTTGTGLNFDVKKSCSKAVSFMVISREADRVSSPTLNSQNSESYPFSSMQCQVGSTFYPNSPLLQGGAPSKSISREVYYYVQSQCSGDFDNAILYDRFYVTTTNENFAMFCQKLTDSSDVMSGLVLNNSRALICNATFHSTADRRVDAYLMHLRLVRVFSNNTTIRD